MIQLFFDYGNEMILVVIEGTNIKFGNTSYGGSVAGIEGLKLDYEGVVKEFPELKGTTNWREIAIENFKKKVKELKSEEKISEYIISDLKKHGYVPRLKQRGGFRPQKIEDVVS